MTLTNRQREECNQRVWWTITNPSLIVDAFYALKLNCPWEVICRNLADDIAISKYFWDTPVNWSNRYIYYMGFKRGSSVEGFRRDVVRFPYTTSNTALRKSCRTPAEIIKRLPVVQDVIREFPEQVQPAPVEFHMFSEGPNAQNISRGWVWHDEVVPMTLADIDTSRVSDARNLYDVWRRYSSASATTNNSIYWLPGESQ